jgi:hypothetical protein
LWYLPKRLDRVGIASVKQQRQIGFIADFPANDGHGISLAAKRRLSLSSRLVPIVLDVGDGCRTRATAWSD